MSVAVALVVATVAPLDEALVSDAFPPEFLVVETTVELISAFASEVVVSPPLVDVVVVVVDICVSVIGGSKVDIPTAVAFVVWTACTSLVSPPLAAIAVIVKVLKTNIDKIIMDTVINFFILNFTP
jgi:hypothetical protein